MILKFDDGHNEPEEIEVEDIDEAVEFVLDKEDEETDAEEVREALETDGEYTSIYAYSIEAD